ncbi:MAG: FAD binding domain-containing protein [Rhodoferax sp.]|nr:FAD binding domain-containing protein [Rhodoferax sp.]MCF8209876.1 FAD binding domain-containing protein [Rhodoferax sp.]
MANSSFQFLRPRTLEAAQANIRNYPKAVVLAGGQHLVPQWRHSRMPLQVISLSHVDDLKGVGLHRGTLSLGAATTLCELSESSIVRSGLGELARLASKMGDRYMRNLATIGGAACTTNGVGCLPAALIGCGATVHTTSRDIPAEEWFAPMGAGPSLELAELVVRMSIPVPLRANHACLRLTPGRFALVTVFATERDGAHRVGFSGLGICSVRSQLAEEWLDRKEPDDSDGLARIFVGIPSAKAPTAEDRYRLSQARRLLRSTALALQLPN